MANIANATNTISGCSRKARKISHAEKLAGGYGLPLFPLAGKVPMAGSHSFKDASRDIRQICEWIEQYPKCNFGLPTGQSSGIVVLDVDPRNGGNKTLEKIQVEYLALPHTVHVRTPSGGDHFYFAESEPTLSRTKPFGPGVEVKADGNYVAIAGSAKNGKRYSYAPGKSIDHLPLAPLPVWIRERVNAAERQKAIVSAFSAGSLPLCLSAALSLDDLIKTTQPKGEGERDAKLFELARGVRFNCQLPNATENELEDILRRWHELASPIIKTKRFRDSWYDFLYAYKNAKCPLGVDVVDLAASTMDLDVMPEAADQFRDDEMRVLVCLCAEIAKYMGGVFFLSCHQVAPRIRVGPKTAWRMLQTLRDRGILEIVRVGNEYRSNRYRWLGGPDQGEK